MKNSITMIKRHIDKLEKQMDYSKQLMQHFTNEHNTLGFLRAMKAYSEADKEYTDAHILLFKMQEAVDILSDCQNKHEELIKEVGLEWMKYI